MITNFFDKIYYINLDEDTNKKKYFETEIQKSQLSKVCSKYPAISGKYLDLRLIPDGFISDNAKQDILLQKQKIYGISLTFGSLACALSHYLIYKECSLSNKPFLIFEDDIIIDKNFDHSLSLVLNDLLQQKYFDILYLGYNEIPGFVKNPLTTNLAKPSGLITGLYGYSISPNGAKKLLNHIFPLNKQIDSSISDNMDKFVTFCSSKKIVNVRIDFGSKTQQNKSCENHINFIPDPIHYDHQKDNWYKLFQ